MDSLSAEEKENQAACQGDRYMQMRLGQQGSCSCQAEDRPGCISDQGAGLHAKGGTESASDSTSQRFGKDGSGGGVEDQSQPEAGEDDLNHGIQNLAEKALGTPAAAMCLSYEPRADEVRCAPRQGHVIRAHTTATSTANQNT